MGLTVVDQNTIAIIDDMLSIVAHMLRSQTLGKVPKEVRVYAQCFAQCCRVSMAELVVAKVYIARLQQRHPNLHAAYAVDSLIRIFITAIILAAKFLNDSVHPNSEWASASGRYSTADVNKMELEFLSLVEYTLFVAPSVANKLLADYTSSSDDDVVPSPMKTSASKAPIKWASGACGLEDMDVVAAVSVVVDGPATTSPDYHAFA
jgi:hypothetical protein